MDWWRRKKKKNKKKQILERGAMLFEDLIKCCDGKSNPIKFFSAHEIRKATDNFSYSNYVATLFDFGYKAYSGKNDNQHEILIKVSRFSTFFCHDIAVSSMVSGHKNFLKVLGCCLELEKPVLVYHGVKKHYKLDISEQPWKRRMKIAEDIATALAYLHVAFPRPFVYRLMSLGKILLDEDGVAKLTDFSDCVSIPKGETFVQVDYVKGTVGYLDDNYIRNRIVSDKTDVFAIGISLQKLIMGQQEWYRARAESDWQFNFIEKQRVDEIVDPKMLENISEEELCQMKAFKMLSLRCVGHIEEVPTMVEVAKELKKIQRSLHHDSSSPSGETQFDSPTMVEMAKEQKKIQRSLHHYSSFSSVGEMELDSPLR